MQFNPGQAFVALEESKLLVSNHIIPTVKIQRHRILQWTVPEQMSKVQHASKGETETSRTKKEKGSSA